MDPVEVREERVATTAPAVPADQVVPADSAVPAERVAPVATTEAVAPATAPVVGTPTTGVPVTRSVAPVAAATGVTSTRVAVAPAGYRTIQAVWLIAGVVDVILALHFIFRAAGANNTGFAHYIYRLGGWLAAPFVGIFNDTTVANGSSVLRWSDVLALAVYTIAAWIVTRLVRILATPRTRVPTA